MLSSDVTHKINRQIANELRTVDSICSDPAEKMAALIEAREETRNRNTPVDFIEALFGMRR